MKKGFTLVELLATIIILGIVVTISVPIVKNIIDNSKINIGLSDAKIIYKTISDYCDTEIAENSEKICTKSMTTESVKSIINLDQSKIKQIIFNGDKIIKLVVENNNHFYTKCFNSPFLIDKEECEKITTGPILDVVLSNFQYLLTSNEGCLNNSGSNYNYLNGCYIQGSNITNKELFLDNLSVLELPREELERRLFTPNFNEQEFENLMFNFYTEKGLNVEEMKQELSSNNITLFKSLYTVESDEYFAKLPINNNYLEFSGLLWRIMGINEDGSVRVITENTLKEIAWGAENDNQEWSKNITSYLNFDFYNSLNKKDLIKSEKFCCNQENVTSNSCLIENSYNLKVGTLTLEEYSLSGGVTSYLNIPNSYWLMTKYPYRIKTPGNFEVTSITTKSNIRALINLDSNTYIINGIGTKENPYKIS